MVSVNNGQHSTRWNIFKTYTNRQPTDGYCNTKAAWVANSVNLKQELELFNTNISLPTP